MSAGDFSEENWIDKYPYSGRVPDEVQQMTLNLIGSIVQQPRSRIRSYLMGVSESVFLTLLPLQLPTPARIEVALKGSLRAEEVLVNSYFEHLKKVGLPFVVIDVGWWYQITFPGLPSGRGNKCLTMPANTVSGDGGQMISYIDRRDIGRFVAKIILDERCVNRYVYAYNDVYTQNEIVRIAERMSGEKVQTKRLTLEEIQREIREAKEILKSDPGRQDIEYKIYLFEYYKAFARGDVTPDGEVAKEMGYLDARKMYPEVKCIGIEEYYQDVLDEKAEKVFNPERKKEVEKLL